jgi:hypothetical protein
LAIIASEPCFAQVSPSPQLPPVVAPQVNDRPRRVVSFTFSPIQMVPPIIKVGRPLYVSKLSGEIRVWDRWGIGLFAGVGWRDRVETGIASSDLAWEGGGQLRRYLVGDFRKGLARASLLWRPQRVTIQFETGDPFACRGVAGGLGAFGGHPPAAAQGHVLSWAKAQPD